MYVYQASHGMRVHTHTHARAGPAVRSVAASALALLRSLAQDWHLLPQPTQAQAARLVCGLLAAGVAADAQRCLHAAEDGEVVGAGADSQLPTLQAKPHELQQLHSTQPAASAAQPPHDPCSHQPLGPQQQQQQQHPTHAPPQRLDDIQRAPPAPPLHVLLQLDPALHWLQRLASAAASARTLCDAALSAPPAAAAAAPKAAAAAAAAAAGPSDAGASAAAAAGGVEGAPQPGGAAWGGRSSHDAGGACLLQLLLSALLTRSRLRQQWQEKQQQQQRQQQLQRQRQEVQHGQGPACRASCLSPPASCSPPDPHPNLGASQALVPAAACALLMLPARAWRGVAAAAPAPPDSAAPHTRQGSGLPDGLAQAGVWLAPDERAHGGSASYPTAACTQPPPPAGEGHLPFAVQSLLVRLLVEEATVVVEGDPEGRGQVRTCARACVCLFVCVRVCVCCVCVHARYVIVDLRAAARRVLAHVGVFALCIGCVCVCARYLIMDLRGRLQQVSTAAAEACTYCTAP